MKNPASIALILSFSFLVASDLPARADSGRAVVAGTTETSTVSGLVTFTDSAEGLKVHAEIKGLTPGSEHGFHIHEYGECADAGKAAGGHYNPAQAPHGHLEKDGHEKAHAGDMGNLSADDAGAALLDTTLPGVVLTGSPVSVAGRAVIVHEKADDFGQPLGNAGARSGCGPIHLIQP